MEAVRKAVLTEGQGYQRTDQKLPTKELRYAIDIVGLTKRFRRATLKRGAYTTIKSSLLELFRPRSRKFHYNEVLRGLTLRIPQGASVGIIGRNGSGKSTLLKLITGIYRPDSGQVKVNGRVAALIELGAGFHPDFTGRENLFLAGIMHGLTRAEITERFDTIVKFAELEDVIDDPVRTYSSGMFMRLGFSLAVHTDPDVLLVDEVLAVGDAAFVSKCKDRISELRRSGKTLLLVTHDLEAVERWCDEALWLHAGDVRDRGDPRRVIDHYREFLERGEEQELKVEQQSPVAAPIERADTELSYGRWGSREIEITSVSLLNSAGDTQLLFHPEDALSVEIKYLIRTDVKDLVFGIALTKGDGTHIHGSNTEIEGLALPTLKSQGVVRYNISRLGLLEGVYYLDLAVHRQDGYPFDYHSKVIKFVVRNPQRQVGLVSFPHRWSFE